MCINVFDVYVSISTPSYCMMSISWVMYEHIQRGVSCRYHTISTQCSMVIMSTRYVYSLHSMNIYVPTCYKTSMS